MLNQSTKGKGSMDRYFNCAMLNHTTKQEGTMQGTEDIQAAANTHYASRFDDELRELVRRVDEWDDGYDETFDRLAGMPLSFQKLTTHHVDETIEWEILLGTGGPADRVIVRTDFNGIIESAEYQYQDWFQPWTAAENQDEDLVKRFAEIVGYYEDVS